MVRILEQEGLSFTSESSQRERCLIQCDFDEFKINSITGPVITSHNVLAQNLGIRAARKRARYFEVPEGRGHVNAEISTLGNAGLEICTSVGAHFDRRGREIPGSGILCVVVGSQHVISLPWDMASLPEGSSGWPRYLKRSFENKELFSEVAPHIDDGWIRRFIFRAITHCYFVSGVPCVRVSNRLPGQPLIAFRIDADGFSDESTRVVLESAQRQSVPLSWFIDTSSWAGNEALIRKMANQHEIGLHCDFHMTFRSEASNLRNINQGRKFLSDAGVEIRSFVAPFGHWNENLQIAVNKFGFDYTSEFSKSLDYTPHPVRVEGHSEVMQIPTIPISIGVWIGERNYWDALADEVVFRFSESGFAVAYDHPLSRLENEITSFEHFIETIRSFGARFCTMSEIQQLFSTRPRLSGLVWTQIGPSFELDGDNPNGFDIEAIEEDLFASKDLLRVSPLFHSTRLKTRTLWRRTIFFSLLSVVPLEVHLGWRRFRLGAWKTSFFRGFRQEP